MKKLLIFFSSLLLVACSNPYKEFYTPTNYDQNTRQTLDLEFLKDNQVPRLLKSKNPELDMSKAMASNYVLLGTSRFVAPIKSRDLLIEQAKNLKATLVLYHIGFADNVEGADSESTAEMTNTLQIIARSYAGHIVDAESGNVIDSQITTAPDTPFIQSAAFFAKNKKTSRFGIKVSPLTEKQKAETGKNTGATITVVFYNSPAFTAELMKGDILTEINQTIVTDPEQAEKLLEAIPADTKKIELKIIRNKKEIIVPLVAED